MGRKKNPGQQQQLMVPRSTGHFDLALAVLSAPCFERLLFRPLFLFYDHAALRPGVEQLMPYNNNGRPLLLLLLLMEEKKGEPLSETTGKRERFYSLSYCVVTSLKVLSGVTSMARAQKGQQPMNVIRSQTPGFPTLPPPKGAFCFVFSLSIRRG